MQLWWIIIKWTLNKLLILWLAAHKLVKILNEIRARVVSMLIFVSIVYFFGESEDEKCGSNDGKDELKVD